MLLTVEEFRRRVRGDCSALVQELQELTGRSGAAEAVAWRNSFQQLSVLLASDRLAGLHLYFGGTGNLSLEYQLPASNAWCDVVLLGNGPERPSAVIVELKDWMIRGDAPGEAEGLIEHQGKLELHPSDQVRGYVEYCRHFHSEVAARTADVHGCVFFTADRWSAAYVEEPNKALTDEFPVFTMGATDVDHRFPQFIAERLIRPNAEFAAAFEKGVYRQDRGFMAQIGKQILDPKSRVFTLLDGQRTAFARCRAVVEEIVRSQSSGAVRRRVVVIEGPPGSGKSVVAAKLWASLVTDSDLREGDVVFTTTSQSQNDNWSELFRSGSGVRGAAGAVRKATTYTPITTGRLKQLRDVHGEDFLKDASHWRDHLQLLRRIGEPFRDGSKDLQNLVTLVDEAHALINPEHRRGRGQFGFAVSLGPQAYHVIRSSVISIFFLDPEQGFRERENTTVADIKKWSNDLGAGDPIVISLAGHQFRCAGSAEYVSWLEGLLRGDDAAKLRASSKAWRRPTDVPRAEKVEDMPPKTYGDSASSRMPPVSRAFDFRVYEEPEGWESALRARIKEGATARLLSTYSREWKTEGQPRPHQLPAHQMDFHEPYEVRGSTHHWSRIWNWVPQAGDYTWFVMGRPGSKISGDPLCEVGCPYAVRGFDYDYIGVLWLDDYQWRSQRFEAQPGSVAESGMSALKSAAARERKRGAHGPNMDELGRRVAQAYRILLTRALKGAYVWVPDAATRDRIKSCLAADPNAHIS